MMGEELHAASTALRMAFQRHIEARSVNLVDAFASAAETVWWICAIDEHLNGGDPWKTTPYSTARDGDAEGEVIPGLRWIRDRHTHQVPLVTGELTTDEDQTPMFGGPGVINISPGFIWRASAQIRFPQARVHGKSAYDAHVAGKKSSAPLYSACRWLQREMSHDLGV